MKKAPRRKEAKEKSEGSSESSAVSTKQENRQLRGKKGARRTAIGSRGS